MLMTRKKIIEINVIIAIYGYKTLSMTIYKIYMKRNFHACFYNNR